MTHVTCRLTAKNRDQLRNPTLGSRVWATFSFFITCSVIDFPAQVRQDSVTLSWTAPKDSGNCPVTNYVVEHCPVGGFQWSVANLRQTVARPSYTVTGLRADTAAGHEFRVSAENKVGQSAPSDVSEPAKYGIYAL